MSKSIKHILVIRLSAMGDVAMSIPVLRAFCKSYPEVKATVLTRGFFKPFFRDLKNVTIYEVDVKGKHKGVLGLFSKGGNQFCIAFVAVSRGGTVDFVAVKSPACIGIPTQLNTVLNGWILLKTLGNIVS